MSSEWRLELGVRKPGKVAVELGLRPVVKALSWRGLAAREASLRRVSRGLAARATGASV